MRVLGEKEYVVGIYTLKKSSLNSDSIETASQTFGL